MTADVTLVLAGHALSFLSFSALFVLVAIGRRSSPFRLTILCAAGGTMIWGLATIGLSLLLARPVIIPFLEWANIAGWLLLTLRLLSAASPSRAATYRRLAQLGLGLPIAVIATFTVLSLAGANPLGPQATNLVEATALIAMIVFGLALVETLVRWMSVRGRTAAMYFFLAVGSLLAIDLFLYATMLLLGRVDVAVYEARGLVLAFVPPFIAVALARQRDWLVDIHVSRQVIVNAATLFGAGMYLLAMAIAGFAVRETNAIWGPMLHVTFLVGAVVLLASILSSEGLRPRLSAWVSRNFFSAKYDYRREWLQFSEALSTGPGHLAVEDRVLDAILQSLACKSGGLWLSLEDDSGFAMASSRPSAPLLTNVLLTELEAAMRAGDGPQRLQSGGPSYSALSGQGMFVRPWVAAPLRHRERLIGYMVLAEPLASKVPDSEDFELLQVLCVQAAGHLAEERSAVALGRAQRFEDTARRLTYIGHDLKNIVSQISLMLQNWARHGDNPSFLKELPNALSASVVRMKGLLEGLKAEANEGHDAVALVNVADCLKPLVPMWRGRYGKMVVDLEPAPVVVQGRLELVQSVFDHLVSNAIDASDGAGVVSVVTRLDKDTLVCEIQDAGCGISAKNVVDSHFRSSGSSKAGGYGVGLFQVRDFVRKLGGTLSFESEPERGTTAKFVLPVVRNSADVALVRVAPRTATSAPDIDAAPAKIRSSV